jgi:hypothetical protein
MLSPVALLFSDPPMQFVVGDWYGRHRLVARSVDTGVDGQSELLGSPYKVFVRERHDWYATPKRAPAEADALATATTIGLSGKRAGESPGASCPQITAMKANATQRHLFVTAFFAFTRICRMLPVTRQSGGS